MARMATKFKNLEAEQARKGYTNEQMAQFLGMSRGNYEAKKRAVLRERGIGFMQAV